MRNITCVLFFFLAINSHNIFADSPGFKCTTKMNEVEKAICSNLYLALLDGTMRDIYSLKYISKEDQLAWLKTRSSNKEELTKNYEDRINNTIAELLTKNNIKTKSDEALLKIGKINLKNIFKYKYFIERLQSKINIDEIILSLDKPIELYSISRANNLLINDGSEFSNEISYHILDLDNDGKLDLIEDDVSGSARISSIDNYCLNETHSAYVKCKMQWSDNLKQGTKVWSIDDFGNDPPAIFFIGNGIYYLDNKFITQLGYVIKNKTVTNECSANWINFIKDELKIENLYREQDRISMLVNACSTIKIVSKSLIELAIKAELYENCRKIIGATKNSEKEVEFFRKACFFKKYSKENFEKMSFVDVCKSDNKLIDSDVKYILQSILLDVDLDMNVKRNKKLCEDILNKITINKKLSLGFCRIADVVDFSFLNKLPQLDSLEILEGGHGICGSIGYIKLKNISILEKLKLKKLSIDLLDNDYDGKKDFWEYLSTTSIKEIAFKGDYYCEQTLKDKKFKELKFLAHNKNTKFTCDGVALEILKSSK